MAPDVNFTKIAENLEGYTGSDIKEVSLCIVSLLRVVDVRSTLLLTRALGVQCCVGMGCAVFCGVMACLV